RHPSPSRRPLSGARSATLAAEGKYSQRSADPPGQPLVPPKVSPAPDRNRRPRRPGTRRAAHQPPHLWFHHPVPHLSGPLAGGSLLPHPETESAGQKFRRHQPQRPEDSNLDRSHRHAPAQISATARLFRLVLVQSRRFAASTTVRLPRPVRFAQPTLRTPAGSGHHTDRATGD